MSEDQEQPARLDRPDVRFPPPLAYLGFLLAGFAIDRWITDWALPITGTLRGLTGLLLVAAGLALVAPALMSFRKAKENPEPWTRSKRLIRSGWYRHTRNPMYLGMTLLYAGLAILIGSPTALLLLPALIWLIQTRVIAREEAYLLARFGSQYTDYMKRVRRWI